jgi:RNA polymerase sigma-70 factor, ECF subfamily
MKNVIGVFTKAVMNPAPTPAELSKLLSRIALGDRAALDALYLHTSAKLFGVLLRLLNDRQEAEDALQEVYIRVWQRADRYSVSAASPISWLVAVTRNHAIDRLRKRKTSAGNLEDAENVKDDQPTPEAVVEAEGEKRRLDHCLEELEAVKAEAVRGAYLDGQSYQELAERHGIPLNTIRTWLRRSLMKLRTCLEG